MRAEKKRGKKIKKCLKTLWFLPLFLSVTIVFLAPEIYAESPKDFSLPVAGGAKTFRLSENRGKVVALHFLLKTECPFCLRFTSEFHSKGKELPHLVQVFIKPDTEAEILKWSAKSSGGPFDIHRDEGAALAKSFTIPGGYFFHNEEMHYPATIILDAKGKEIFRYIGKSNRDRLSFENFSSEVAKATNIRGIPPAK